MKRICKEEDDTSRKELKQLQSEIEQKTTSWEKEKKELMGKIDSLNVQLKSLSDAKLQNSSYSRDLNRAIKENEDRMKSIDKKLAVITQIVKSLQEELSEAGGEKPDSLREITEQIEKGLMLVEKMQENQELLTQKFGVKNDLRETYRKEAHEATLGNALEALDQKTKSQHEAEKSLTKLKTEFELFKRTTETKLKEVKARADQRVNDTLRSHGIPPTGQNKR